MTAHPVSRFSFADWDEPEEQHRDYMLACDEHCCYVSVTKDRVFEMKSNFSANAKELAEEWIQEVARDVTAHYGGDARTIYKMLKDGL